MSKEVCLFAGADWLKIICQSEGGERSIERVVWLKQGGRSAVSDWLTQPFQKLSTKVCVVTRLAVSRETPLEFMLQGKHIARPT